MLACSSHTGDSPAFAIYRTESPQSLIREVEAQVRSFTQEGLRPEQIAVISFGGQKHSALLQQERLAGLPCRRFTGQYDAAGNAVWTPGTLLVETLYRYKGQCAPAVILAGVDAEELDARFDRRLFVGLTRATERVACVVSERVAKGLLGRV